MQNVYKKYGIYGIQNKINGHLYIGKTMVSFGDRWDCHKGQLRGGYHDNRHLQNAWNKYGEDNFSFIIIHDCTNKESVSDVNQLEIEYIQEYKNRGVCLYNIAPGGDGGLFFGKHLPEDVKKKIGEKNREHMLGRKLSEETKQKMSQSQKERYSLWSPQDRKEWGQKVGVQNKGRKWTPEQRTKLKNNKNGATLSIEQVKQIRYLHENKNLSYTEIASIMQLHRHTVYQIATYRRWKET